MKKRLKDKKALKIIEDIIDSTNFEYVNDTIKILLANYNKKYPDKIVNLPLYNYGKGLPIGYSNF